MTERLRNIVPPLILLVVLAGAVLWRGETGLSLADPDARHADQLRAVLDDLDEGALVLVGFDPDVGTYAEVRPTVRTLLADLLQRDATLAFVSLTAEGRALAVAELARLGRAGVNAGRLVDLGFLPGAEAALVAVARAVDGVHGLRAASGSMDLTDTALAVVIGGNEIGPRSWVEQVGPRTDELRMVAVTPTVLLPEVEPYVADGQLAAVISTPREGAAYRERASLDALVDVGDAQGPSPLAVLIGLLAAIGVLGAALVAAPGQALRAWRGRERP